MSARKRTEEKMNIMKEENVKMNKKKDREICERKKRKRENNVTFQITRCRRK
jgi:hypothetical protein